MTATIVHRHGHKCDLIAGLGLPHDTPLIEWHESVTQAIVGRASTSSYDHPITPPAAAPGTTLLVAIMLEAGITVASLNGYTALGESAPVAHDVPGGGHPTYRLALFTRTAPAGPGPVPVPTFTTAFWDTPWTMVAFDGATAITATSFDTAADAHSHGTPTLAEHQLRVWGTIGVNQHITAPGDVIGESNPPADPAALNGVNVVITADTSDLPATVSDTAGWVAAALTVTFQTTDTWRNVPDRTAALIDYTTQHGRPTPTQATDPLTAGARLARTLIDRIPTAGSRFRLTLNADVADALGVAEADRPRFTGEITDVDVDARGDLSIVNVAGLGRRARLTRQPVTTVRPQEADGERIRRILAQVAIALPLEVGTIEPGTVTLLEAAPEAVAAQTLIDQVQSDALGQLVEHRSGRLDYHDAGHRRGRTSLLTLTGADHLIQPFTWRQNVASLVNDATATYGPARDQVRVVDPVSADPSSGSGPYGVQLDTQLAGILDAYALLTNLVGRYSRPAWWLPSMLVDLYRTAGDRLGPLLALTHGDKITATDLPPDGAFTAGDVFVEGTTETGDAAGWRIQLAVADPTLAGAGLRWIDLPRFLRWIDVDPALTWLDLATMTDPYAIGTPVAGGGDADDATVVLIIDGGTAAPTPADYVLEGSLP